MDLKEQMRTEWTELAEEWMEAVRIGGDRNPHREGMLDSWMLDAAGDVSGQRVIDLGCGEGRFSRMLADRAAIVTGIDLCEPFVEYALENRTRGEDYFVADMEDLSRIEDAAFDMAVSYVTLVDVLNLESAVGEAYRVLRPGGRFVVCNLHPMVSAGNGWIKHGTTKLHFKLGDYFDEGTRQMQTKGKSLTNFHRSLSSYVSSFLGAGFTLDGIREPKPSPEQAAEYPYIADNLRVPEFIIYLLRKPLT